LVVEKVKILITANYIKDSLVRKHKQKALFGGILDTYFKANHYGMEIMIEYR